MNGTGIIYSDSEADEATRSLFGRTLPATQQYIQENIQRYCHNLGQHMNGFADNIMQKFHNFNSNYVMNKIEHFRNQLNNTWQTDSIRPLTSLELIRQATPSMHRWVMAHPTLRSSWNREGCSGYSGHYQDNHPGGVAEEHYDYRRVMNGVIDNGKYTNYHEPILDPTDVLTIFEKNAIRHTWSVLDQLLENTNSDPTDPWSNGTIV